MAKKEYITKVGNTLRSAAKAKPLLYGAVGLGVYLFVIRPLLRKVGFLESAQKKAERQALTNYATHTQRTERLTFPAAKYTAMAEVIYNSLYKSLENDDERAVYDQFQLLENAADLAALKQAFGFRHFNILFFNTGSALGLDAFLRSALSASEIRIINDILNKKGINYRF